MKKNHRLLIAFSSALALLLALNGCASDDAAPAGPHVRATPEQVMNRCLNTVATQGFGTPTESTLSSWQWKRYVSCKLGGNMWMSQKKVPPDGDALVSIRLASDGSIVSVKLLHSSGNDDLDDAVARAIDAASPLPPAPLALHLSRVDLHFQTARVNPAFLQGGMPAIGGTNAGGGIHDETHWRIKNCNIVGGVGACD
ncbi:TonB family protein [Paraburkholderia bannensis]|uniref:TonB family protein n=1 Tax=Paraburkholderia bannensis TaxID=765414 RepID=A0A7W9WTY9_9BURK|nr:MULTISPECIES: energy transducer TonB [Paraburkholderia]MBB3258812.1 TonB family protein [Paraburkholderia sp. WP4_3_2]MBB6103826.1 TonB family protein [Paraburkholderia bannensis]